ncbi:8-oxo-dGTP diphosphatase [Halorussus aquaticus]|uniref:Oxidized purine nucleoside triphosphate hydrolase n=1 Tax=Halorussus aquaticus TaxID=2953748 RepID=A0ABD5Q8R9_9EURY|nr:8-oxo-dGTP diphosphatase [Halorussus aquaticus]
MRDATLCYVFDGNDVLFIEKKRGHGEGRYVGPGGKVENGESIAEGAIRETREETSIIVDSVEKKGELEFYFAEEPFMQVHVFRSDSYSGKPAESEEAIPVWLDATDLPYDEMWKADKHWLPHLIEGTTFTGTFWYDEDGDDLHEYSLETDSKL